MTAVRVCVLGATDTAVALAADLALAGHEVRLAVGTADEQTAIRAAKGVRVVEGSSRVAPIAAVSVDAGEILPGADVVVAAVSPVAHDELPALLAPHVTERQLIVLVPGLLGAYVIARELGHPGRVMPWAIAETATRPVLVRRSGPGEVTITARAVELPVGVFPGVRRRPALDRLRALFPAVHPCVDVLDAALANAAPAVDAPAFLLNAGAIDRGGFSAHAEGATPTVRRLIAAVDGERLETRRGWGYPEPHWAIATAEAGGGTTPLYIGGGRVTLGSSAPRGGLDHDRVTDDVALGLPLLESAARTVGVDTPATTGLLGVLGVLADRPLSGRGRALEHLGLGDLAQREIVALLQEGWGSSVWSRLVRSHA